MAYSKKWFTNYNGSKWRGNYTSKFYQSNLYNSIKTGNPNVDRIAYMAAKAMKQIKILKSQTQRELKCADTWLNSAISTAQAMIIPVAVVKEGSAKYQRVGSKIRVKSVYLTGSMAINPSQTAQTSVRIALVIDSDARSTGPTYADIFDNYDTTGSSGLGDLDAPVNVFTFPNRFRVIYDAYYNLFPTTSIEQNSQTFREKVKNNMKSGIYRKVDLPISFQQSPTGTGVATNNQIYLVMYQTVGSNLMYWNYNVRIKYYDD